MIARPYGYFVDDWPKDETDRYALTREIRAEFHAKNPDEPEEEDPDLWD